jgi:three-Cys-motif partner protein
MTEQSFGGRWTDEKLGILDEYLVEYTKIFAKNENAKYFSTWYVDAFAGTGARTEKSASPETLHLFREIYEDADKPETRDGSARIALKLARPFNKYLFIDNWKAGVSALKVMVTKDHANLLPRCQFEYCDANEGLRTWCGKRDWAKERAVVFLDPFGMQVEWGTITALAATKGVDLLYLFPLMGVMRVLKWDGNIEESWRRRLDLLFGTDDWRTWFYRTPPAEKQARMAFDLGGLESNASGKVERDVTEENIQEFIEMRLKTCFAGVAKGLILRNSRSSPLYLLCFAAANKKGAAIGGRIAQHLLSPQRALRKK